MKHIANFEDFLNENKAEIDNVINVLYAIEDEIWTKLNIKAGSQLYANQTTQQNYINMAHQLIQSANIEKFLKKYAKKISDTLRADNYHSLNVFLGASGYYDPKLEKYFKEIVQTNMPGYGWDAELFQK
jgi:hypothetical protein